MVVPAESRASRAHMIAVNDESLSSFSQDMSNKKQILDLNMSQYYLGNEHGQLIHDEQFGSHNSDN